MAKAKKALALFLVLTMFTCSFLSVSAQTTQTSENPLVCYESTEEIQPRLKYFESVFCNISEKEGNIACTGDYTSFASGIDVTLAVGLEKQSGSSWKAIKTWSRTFSPGYGSNIVGGTYPNPSSGNYRAVTTAMAKNSNGVILETIQVYSRTITI